ncbi:MAG: serine/threonine protein phosphatase PrpC [Lentisphaeria bacterium]|jgi:serine/threonine protein phosphatase PrpC
MTDTTYRRPIAWKSYHLTDVGCVRAANEDALVCVPETCLWGVADGMGGHEVGDVASQKIVDSLQNLGGFQHLSDYVDAVENAIIETNRELVEYARRVYENKTMGSTVVCLLIVGHVGVALWVGDSRLYRFRNNKLSLLTRDHSQVAEMVKMGLISEAEAEHHPHRNVITRAVGVEPEVFVDINVFSAQVGDTFLLCSDGLYNSVAADVLESKLQSRDPEECVLGLMTEALENGAQDNVSIVVVKGEPGKLC